MAGIIRDLGGLSRGYFSRGFAVKLKKPYFTGFLWLPAAERYLRRSFE